MTRENFAWLVTNDKASIKQRRQFVWSGNFCEAFLLNQIACRSSLHSVFLLFMADVGLVFYVRLDFYCSFCKLKCFVCLNHVSRRKVSHPKITRTSFLLKLFETLFSIAWFSLIVQINNPTSYLYTYFIRDFFFAYVNITTDSIRPSLSFIIFDLLKHLRKNVYKVILGFISCFKKRDFLIDYQSSDWWLTFTH